MPFPFAAIAGAVIPSLVGGLFDRDNARRVNKASSQAAQSMSFLDRQRQLKDKADDRRYLATITKSDRRYAENLTASDRRYSERLLSNDRKYAEKITKGDRRYFESQLAQDRRYAAGVADRERKLFETDRAKLQRLSDRQAERAAASRGIDFKRIREDAEAAGFNPLTAMQFAQSYSTDVGYGVSGGAYGGGQVVPMSSGAAGGGGAPVSGGGGSTPVMPTASGGVGVTGSGYQREFAPVLASSSFVAEALDAGISTYFNTMSERDDARYQNIADQVARSQIAREVARQTPRPFGYNLSRVEPYRPAHGVYAPPFTGKGTAGLDPVHGREVEAQPVQDVPATAKFDLGFGTSVRGLSPDVEWSEPAQLGNELWLGGNAIIPWVRNIPAVAKFRQDLSNRNEVRRQARARAKARARVPAGTPAYSMTGTVPRAPVWSW